MVVRIRNCREEDMSYIAHILRQWWVDASGKVQEDEVDYLARSVRESFADGDAHYMVATSKVKEGVIGLLGWRESRDRLRTFSKTDNPVELYVLFIDKDMQGRGVANTLVKSLESDMQKSGYTEVLVLSADRWKDAWGFYDSLGYERVGTLPHRTQAGESQIWRKKLL